MREKGEKRGRVETASRDMGRVTERQKEETKSGGKDRDNDTGKRGSESNRARLRHRDGETEKERESAREKVREQEEKRDRVETKIEHIEDSESERRRCRAEAREKGIYTHTHTHTHRRIGEVVCKEKIKNRKDTSNTDRDSGREKTTQNTVTHARNTHVQTNHGHTQILWCCRVCRCTRPKVICSPTWPTTP